MSVYLKVLLFFAWTLAVMTFFAYVLMVFKKDEGRLFDTICFIGSISLYTTAIMGACYVYWLIFTK